MVPSSNASTHGTADPYSKRSTSSLLIVTLPEMPRTSRTTCEVVSAERHEIGQLDRSSRGVETRDQDQRPVAVFARDPRRILGRETPTPVLAVPEQRGEAGAGIEAWPAQPINRTVATYQRSRDTVADEGIVLETNAGENGGSNIRVSDSRRAMVDCGTSRASRGQQ